MSDLKWAKEQMKKTNKNNCKKDFMYFSKDKQGNIFYRDLSMLPKKNNGKYIDWRKTKNATIKLFIYGETYEAKVSFKKYKGTHNIVILRYKDKEREISVSHLCHRNHESLIGKRRPHNYMPEKGNSLYDKEHWLVDYVEDENELKKHSPKSKNYLSCTCPRCHYSIERQISILTRDNFRCPYCGTGTSYPEKFLMSYFKCKNIVFEHQKIEDTLQNRRFDFYLPEEDIYIEAHGMQHYDKKQDWYKDTLKQDTAKRHWCSVNNKTLIELDCRYSEYDYIKKSIEQSMLCDITTSDESYIKSKIVDLSNYDFKRIIELYEKHKSSYIVGDIIGVSQNTVLNCLRKAGIDTSNTGKTGSKKLNENLIIELYKQEKSIYKVSKILNYNPNSVNRVLKRNGIVKYGSFSKIICINTGEVFKSLKEAANWCGLKGSSNISSVCRGERSSAGKHPVTGEKLTWEYVD